MVVYDIAIIGAGPAGLAAAIYAARYKLKAIIIGKKVGGYMTYAHVIENYPGLKEVPGPELTQRMQEQVQALGVKVIEKEVEDISKTKDGYKVIAEGKNEFLGKTLILALGTERRKLNLKNEEKYIGKGVSYCATCDAPLFRNKDVVVVGGGDAAAMTAMLLSKYAKKIYMVYLELFMDPLWLGRTKKNKKIKMMQGTVKELVGNEFIQAVKLNDGKKLSVQGIFIEIGSAPSTYFAKELGIKTDSKGYALTNKRMETNVPGIFVAGDMTNGPLKQIVTAAADGATAASSAHLYLKSRLK